MNLGRQRFTLKIILSYLVLVALAVFVSIFLYNELKDEFNTTTETAAEKRYIETGSLLISLYETDRFSKIALLTLDETDFNNYLDKNDSLFGTIEYIKKLTSEEIQKQQLDSIKILLRDKEDNIAELRSLKIENSNDTSLDAILKEFKSLEDNIGKLTVENFVANPEKLSKKELQQVQRYVDYMNRNRQRDSINVPAAVIDSILGVTRYIVLGAKRNNRQLKASLVEKESELITNDLIISEKIQQMMYAFDSEITRKQSQDKQQKVATVTRSSKVLKTSAVLGAIVILLFSYWLITDFFKAEKLKNKLQKEKQTTEALLKSREQLIATVSHDLKTPLSTIMGYTELFKNTSLSEKQAFYNANIGDNAAYIAKLADDLLDLSKLEAGKLRLDKTPFKLKAIIEQIAEDQQALHKEKSVKLTVSIDKNLSTATYLGDALRIRQIITNLVSNAFKFTSEGEINISATPISEDIAHKPIVKDHDIISLAVKDTGIGIEREKQARIFHEFTQADDDTTQRYGGSGLGLTISKKLTLLLGGTLDVTSKPGEGSTFICTIPLERTDAKVITVSSETNPLKGLSAVIIDDDLSILQMLKEVFEQFGLRPILFSQFSDLNEKVVANADFILTDMQMPMHSGFDVLYAMKTGVFSNHAAIPVILMTGDRSRAEHFYIDKGFAAMLQKPFTPNTLYKTLVNLFSSEATLTASEENSNISKTDYDLSLLRSFMGSDHAVRDMLQTFFVQSEKDQQELHRSIETEDYKAIQSIAHKMLTMWRQLEANTIVSLLEPFEQPVAAGLDRTNLAKKEEILQREILKITTQLKAI